MTQSTIQRLGTTKRWSDIVVHGGTVYLVEVPSNLTADITEQSKELLHSVAQQLLSVGSSNERILMATIYLADIREIDAFNAVWDDWIPAGTAPVRACVEAKLAHPSYRVEVQLMAAIR